MKNLLTTPFFLFVFFLFISFVNQNLVPIRGDLAENYQDQILDKPEQWIVDAPRLAGLTRMT